MTVSSSQLHPTAERMYRYIIRYKRMSGGDSPTRRELAAGVGLPSVSMVQHHLDALERAGKIKRLKRGKARMIAIPFASWEFDEVGATGQNKCAVSAGEEGDELPEEERKVRERLGVFDRRGGGDETVSQEPTADLG